MRRNHKKAVLICLICLLILFLACWAFSLFSDDVYEEAECNDSEKCNKLHWLEEESCYLGSEIDGRYVKLRYSLVFENHAEVDYRCSQMNAKFSFWELLGWIKYEQFYDGEIVDGADAFVVPSGEKVKVTFVFTGEYTGGDIKDNISAPVEILFLLR